VSTGAPDPDQHDRAVVSQERARAFLAEGELELLGRIPWASNATVLAKVTHEGLEGLAVYKPARGERPLWDFPDGTLYRREVAAYLVSEQLGWRLVPPTLARDGPLGVGSVQLYVDADPEVTAFELLADGHPALPRIAAFDVVTNNAATAWPARTAMSGRSTTGSASTSRPSSAPCSGTWPGPSWRRRSWPTWRRWPPRRPTGRWGRASASCSTGPRWPPWPDGLGRSSGRAACQLPEAGVPTHGRWSEKILMMGLWR